MKTNYIPSSILKAGMVIHEDIYNSLGVLVLNENSILDQWKIDKIHMNNIDRVRVRLSENNEFLVGEDTEELKSAFDSVRINDFRKKYIAEVDEVTHIIKEISNGAVINIRSVSNLSRHMIKEFSDTSDVINYLQLVRHLDDHTYSHSLNVSLMSIIIAKWLRLSDAEISEIATAGLLHDIGKTKVSEKLLMKPGKLTTEEFGEVKKHAVIGYMIMDKMEEATSNMKYTVLLHHEKIDGTGYPTGAHGDEMPLFPKIVAIADIYGAMTSNRSYRDRMCPFEVIKNFEMQAFGKLDTKVLTVFLKNIANSYIGDFVELNSGEICEIVYINPNRIWQPIVRHGTELIDLSQDKDKRFIKAIV